MTHFKAFTYIGKKTARKVLTKIENSNATSIWQEKVALISVDEKGRIKAGGVIGEHHRAIFDKPSLREFGASLVNDSSALIFLGTTEAISEFAAAVADDEYDAAAFDALLDEAAVAELMNSIGNK